MKSAKCQYHLVSKAQYFIANKTDSRNPVNWNEPWFGQIRYQSWSTNHRLQRERPVVIGFEREILEMVDIQPN